MEICPNCGWSFKEKKMINYNRDISKLYVGLDPQVRHFVKEILREINKNLPIRQDQHYMLLKNITELNDKELTIQGIQDFFEAMKPSFGIPYLMKVIENKVAERNQLELTYGSKPPTKTPK